MMPERVHMIHGEPVIAITTGQAFNFLNPDPDTIHIEDIAESLAKDARYCGKTPDVFFSVAEHSVMCSYEVPEEYALMALLHDAAEAYTGDHTSPYKKLVAQTTGVLKEIDRRISRAILKKFGVEPYSDDAVMAPCVHDADGYVYLQERYQLCHPDAQVWWDYHGAPNPDYPRIRCLEWRDAKAAFLARFRELYNES